MIVLLYLLASFGLAFGFQNRMPVLHEWAVGGTRCRRLLAHLLVCTFCVGFWAGWLSWGLSWMVHGLPVIEQRVPLNAEWPLWVVRPLGGLVWAFVSAGVCVLLDAILLGAEDLGGPG